MKTQRRNRIEEQIDKCSWCPYGVPPEEESRENLGSLRCEHRPPPNILEAEEAAPNILVAEETDPELLELWDTLSDRHKACLIALYCSRWEGARLGE